MNVCIRTLRTGIVYKRKQSESGSTLRIFHGGALLITHFRYIVWKLHSLSSFEKPTS